MKMGKQLEYTLSKLSEINYRMAVHEGDANHRLASEAENIILLLPHEVPEEFRLQFDKMTGILKTTLNGLKSFILTPYKIHGIRNVTCSKYLALLINIEDALRQTRDDALEKGPEIADNQSDAIIIDNI
jgi:hypothetical protein